MKSFQSNLLEHQPIPHRLILTIGKIREAKGREALYKQQQPQALETLRQAAIIQSTESSNRIEGITAPIRRIKALVEETSIPRIRMSSLQPQDLSDEVIGLWRSPRLCRHFHLALQSGSEGVLRRMRRRYDAATARSRRQNGVAPANPSRPSSTRGR